MKFERLEVEGLRCLQGVSVRPGPGLNLFVGENGAGKTSLLEAAYLLSYGRSFRRGSQDTLVQRGADTLHVFAEIRDRQDRLCRLGIGREHGKTRLRVNDGTVERISDLLRYCVVVCFEPGTHALIGGPAETRRRFLDWGVFHVEQNFLDAWRRYQRALKQRNALLRAPAWPQAQQLGAWELEMAGAACQVDIWRHGYLVALEQELRSVSALLLPELGELTLRYRPGWDRASELGDILERQRERDRLRGYTGSGIHRADWRISYVQAPRHEYLSRGQEKLCALACVLAQAQLHAHRDGDWPVICLDDLASELDENHQHAVLDWLGRSQAQVFMTGTHAAAGLSEHEVKVFHVEQGAIRDRTDKDESL